MASDAAGIARSRAQGHRFRVNWRTECQRIRKGLQAQIELRRVEMQIAPVCAVGVLVRHSTTLPEGFDLRVRQAKSVATGRACVAANVAESGNTHKRR